jgi:hypothetical protein
MKKFYSICGLLKGTAAPALACGCFGAMAVASLASLSRRCGVLALFCGSPDYLAITRSAQSWDMQGFTSFQN